MEQGRVEVVRQADGRTVEVEQGKYVRATADPTLEPLVTRPLPELLSQPWNVLNTTTRLLAFSSTGEQLAFHWRDRVSVWNATEWRIDHTFNIPDREVRDVEFLPGRPELAVVGRTFTFKVLGAADGKKLYSYTSPNRVILPSVRVSPQTGEVFWLEQERGKSLALKRWTPPEPHGDVPPVVEPETLGTTTVRDVLSLAVSADGKMVIAGTRQGKLVFWNVGNQLEGTVVTGPPRRITALTFSPDGHWLAVAQEGEVRVWEVATRTVHQRLEGQGRNIVSLAFSPDGSLLAAGRNDGTAKLWNHLNGEELATIAHSKRGAVRCLAFAPHGRLLVTGVPGKPVLVWNLEGDKVTR
jgi:WD40 repeat protein